MISLTTVQEDSFQEIFNIGVGRAASLLNDLVSSHITLQVPQIKFLSHESVISELEGEHYGQKIASVCLEFSGTMDGKAHLFFPLNAASLLVATATGEGFDSPDLDAIRVGTLTEIGNILINSIVGSISNLLSQKFNYSLPNYIEGEAKDLLKCNEENSSLSLLIAQTSFLFEELQITGKIALIFEEDFVDLLLVSLNKLESMY
jgi:chemotaxis protein CheC